MTEQDPARPMLTMLLCAAAVAALMTMPPFSSYLPVAGATNDAMAETERSTDGAKAAPPSRLQRAIDAYDAALEKTPDDLLLLCERAHAHAAAGNIDAAIADYTRYNEIEPNASMYYNRAILYHEGKKDDIAALADYSRAIELDPRKTEAYVNRANVHRDLKQYEQALAGYATAEALDPAHLNIYRNRGWLYQKLGQTQRAREDYERGLKLEPNDPWLQQAIRALDRPGL